jgi:hypothetical protein
MMRIETAVLDGQQGPDQGLRHIVQAQQQSVLPVRGINAADQQRFQAQQVETRAGALQRRQLCVGKASAPRAGRPRGASGKSKPRL